jgi:hypothetical protein
MQVPAEAERGSAADAALAQSLLASALHRGSATMWLKAGIYRERLVRVWFQRSL